MTCTLVAIISDTLDAATLLILVLVLLRLGVIVRAGGGLIGSAGAGSGIHGLGFAEAAN
jgi:hypothetical protein